MYTGAFSISTETSAVFSCTRIEVELTGYRYNVTHLVTTG